jgi:GNAT superfamily N-acetyltransferase
MATTAVNPAWLDREEYRAFLNVGFPRQWDRASYQWYVARGLDSLENDLIVRTAGGRIVAGVTLCYRHVAVGRRSPIKVCVASAGTTLPNERRQGHYAALLEAATARGREAGCTALIGFVTRDNGSGKGLTQIGARALPSFYISSSRPAAARRRVHAVLRPQAIYPAKPLALSLARLARDALERQTASVARFHYRDAADWIHQFIDRPHAVNVVRLAHDSLALIETVPACAGHPASSATDRLQWLECPATKKTAYLAQLACLSAAAQRQFFAYTLDPRLAEAARRSGLRVIPGHLMLLGLSQADPRWEDLMGARWHVQSGDRL